MDRIVNSAIEAVVSGKQSFCRYLTANDTGKSGAHQSGFYVPKSVAAEMFDIKGKRGEVLTQDIKICWQNEFVTDSKYKYYGDKTRNEYRVTRCLHKDFRYIDENNTGALLVMSKNSPEDYSAWVLNTDEDIDTFLEYFGMSPVETGNMIRVNSISSEEHLRIEIDSFMNKMGTEFPSGRDMASAAQRIHEAVYDHIENIIKYPDSQLVKWLSLEYELFRKVEDHLYGGKIYQGFATMQEFIDVANSILNRRKSRAGKSLEYHLETIFDVNKLPYDAQAVTEKNKKPDFLFPSEKAYHDMSYNADKLILLAAKTTCKDRWRQVMSEADRIKTKFLCTLQQGISSNQMEEMKAANIILVVPQEYIKTYPKEYRDDIFTLSKFIGYVHEKLNT